jgi:hypothetical protein
MTVRPYDAGHGWHGLYDTRNASAWLATTHPAPLADWT